MALPVHQPSQQPIMKTLLHGGDLITRKPQELLLHQLNLHDLKGGRWTPPTFRDWMLLRGLSAPHQAFCAERLLHFTPPVSTKEAQCLASLLFNIKNNIYHIKARYSKPFVESPLRLLVLNLDQRERRLSKKFRLQKEQASLSHTRPHGFPDPSPSASVVNRNGLPASHSLLFLLAMHLLRYQMTMCAEVSMGKDGLGIIMATASLLGPIED